MFHWWSLVSHAAVHEAIIEALTACSLVRHYRTSHSRMGSPHRPHPPIPPPAVRPRGPLARLKHMVTYRRIPWPWLSPMARTPSARLQPGAVHSRSRRTAPPHGRTQLPPIDTAATHGHARPQPMATQRLSLRPRTSAAPGNTCSTCPECW